MKKCANISPYMRRPLLIATAPIWISLYMWKFDFLFYQCVFSKEARISIQFITHPEPSCLFSTAQCMGNLTITMMVSRGGGGAGWPLAVQECSAASSLVPPGTEPAALLLTLGLIASTDGPTGNLWRLWWCSPWWGCSMFMPEPHSTPSFQCRHVQYYQCVSECIDLYFADEI